MIKIYTTVLAASGRFERHMKAMELLMFAINREWGVTGQPRIGSGEYKKPYLTDYQDIYFNLTYTFSRVFCAVSDENVGIDAEDIEEAPFDISPLYFTADENEYLYKGDSNRRFYEIWTKKESYMKYKGTGFFTSPLSFTSLNINDAFIKHINWGNISLAVCAKKPFGFDEESLCII